MLQTIKVLIAVDGSESSMDAVRYAGGFFDPGRTIMTLIHITTTKSQAEEMMAGAKSVLMESGYSEEAIEIRIASLETGVAKDVTAECARGYDALIVGRRGLKDPTETMVGATAYQMLKTAENLPVAVVGTGPDPKHVLIGFDGSENAFRAVDFATVLMPRPGREVTLCHVAQAEDMSLYDVQTDSRSRQNTSSDERNRLIKEFMEKARERLVDAGFDPEGIKEQIIELRTSRAATISRTAESLGCGTIVIGRRGLSMVHDFMIGRVTMKVLHRAHELAVWVV